MSTETLPDCPGCGEKADPRFYFRDVMTCDGCWPDVNTSEGWKAMLVRCIALTTENARLLAERTPRPVPEGWVRRARGTIATGDGACCVVVSGNMFQICEREDMRESCVGVPRDVAIAALADHDAHPALAARIEALEAERDQWAHRAREAEAAWGHLDMRLNEEMSRDVLPEQHGFVDNPHHPGTCRRHVTYPNQPTACCGYPPEAHQSAAQSAPSGLDESQEAPGFCVAQDDDGDWLVAERAAQTAPGVETVRIWSPEIGEIPSRQHHLTWNGVEWVDERCGCRFHPDDNNNTHGGGPHVHPCADHALALVHRRLASAPSGLDETQPPPGWRALSLRMPYPDGRSRHEHASGRCTLAEAWATYRAESAPAVAAATRELRAERDRLMRGWASTAAEVLSIQGVRNRPMDVPRAAAVLFGTDEARRLFPAPTPDTSGPQEPGE